MQHDQPPPDGASRLRTVSRLAFFGFAAIALYFLITEHRAHLYGILPFLLLAACPLLHLFHHRGHGGGDEESRGSGPRGNEPSSGDRGSAHQH